MTEARLDVEQLRVLQIIPVLLTGGLERVATALALGLAPRVDAVTVCTRGGEPFESEMRAAGIPLILMPRPKTSRPKDFAVATARVARSLRGTRPHVIHAHNPTAAVVAVLSRRIAGLSATRIVTTYHGVPPQRLGRAVSALRHSDVVVGVGPTSTRALVQAGLDPLRTTTVFNAVDTLDSPETTAARTEFDVTGDLVVSVGRYVPEKDHALLIAAAARLAPRRPGLRVLIVGVGPLEEELRARVRDLGLEGVVLVTGERRDAPALAAAADVFVLSSLNEGLPIALLEAMAGGVPVVATDVGGVGDAVRDGETGLLVPHGDAEKLAQAIERVLDDRALGGRLGAAARRFVERECSMDAMVDGYLETYLRAVDARYSASRTAGAVRSRRRAGASPSK